MTTCDKCGEQSQMTTTVFSGGGGDGAPLSARTYCRACRPRQNPDVAKNPFENFRLDNFRSDGKPLTVNSLRELRAAEKEHGVALAMMSDDDISKPPQHDADAGMLHRGYRKKWNRDESAYSPERVAEASKGVGVVRDRSETLAD